MRYEHKQVGGLHWLLLVTAVLCAVGGYVTRDEGWSAWVLYGAALLVAVLALCFMSLTVRDAGDALRVGFGPIPLFRTRIPYARITSAQPARSRLVDGWGVHWIPGRGWTWNLWGFDCVEMTVGGKRMRVGTDDRAGLAAFVQSKIEQQGQDQESRLTQPLGAAPRWSAGMDPALDLELKKLIVGTNDQRRRVGQTLYHFYRTLIFWQDKGLSLFEITRAWSAAGAMIFDALAGTMRELGTPAEDEHLRRFVASFFVQLSEDLERGDHMLIPFLRWIQEQFPEITRMMRSERADSRIYDVELAELLSQAFAHAARADREGLVRLLAAAGREIAPG